MKRHTVEKSELSICTFLIESNATGSGIKLSSDNMNN